MSTYIIALTFAIPIFVILIGLEAFVAYRKGIQINKAADMISSPIKITKMGIAKVSAMM
jgi:hypothetical protein